MMNQIPPLTFGVELEFALASTWFDEPDPEPSNNRVVCFPPNDDDWELVKAVNEMDGVRISRRRMEKKETFILMARNFAAKRHIRETLHKANIPVNLEETDQDYSDYTEWEVIEDPSIEGPTGTRYRWLQIEVRSPARPFSAQSLDEVEKVCSIISSNYHISMGDSCGLHVHAGDRSYGFDFPTLSNLAAFLWAFEPQLESIHSIDRMHSRWCTSMRENNMYTLEYADGFGARPHPMAGVVHFLSLANSSQLYGKFQAHHATKLASYNFGNIREIRRSHERSCGGGKQTIEFRQHQGTMDGVEVVTWIKTVIGMVDYVKNVDMSSLLTLLTMTRHEEWEKLGDGKDGEREAMQGPILAEGRFTIVDLLNHMGLSEPAEYYRSRWYKHDKTRDEEGMDETPGRYTWRYMTKYAPDSREFARRDRLRKIWDKLQIAAAAQPASSKEFFDPNDPMWPKHHRIGEDAPSSSSGSERDAETDTTRLGSTDKRELDIQIAAALQNDERGYVRMEDEAWRTRLRTRAQEWYDQIDEAKGSENPFDDSLPRRRPFWGRNRVGSAEVSPGSRVEREEREGSRRRRSGGDEDDESSVRGRLGRLRRRLHGRQNRESEDEDEDEEDIDILPFW